MMFFVQNGFPDTDADSHIRQLLQEAQLPDTAEGPSEISTSSRVSEEGSTEVMEVSAIPDRLSSQVSNKYIMRKFAFG